MLRSPTRCGARAAWERTRRRETSSDPETGDIVRPSGNYRLTALQAAVALPQLARLDRDVGRRAAAAAALAEALVAPMFRPLARDPRVTRDSYAQFWIRYDPEAGGVSRERVARAVQAEGIPLFTGWCRPGYTHQVYTPGRAAKWLRERGSGRDPHHYERACCPGAERAAFDEALLLDFPILDGAAEVIRDAAAALTKVAEGLPSLR
jgi:dTDP-4-amino-4,6-dideoxygalactose transaminase